jgi:2-phospho-L-lactate guanylyltransferase
VTSRLAVVIPLRALEGAKSRLGEVLDAEERRDLVVGLFDRTVRAALGTPGVDEVIVVSPDPAVLVLGADAGARPLRQVGSGLNAALEQARSEAMSRGATALLVLPSDLARVAPDALAPLVALAAADDSPTVALVPDRHGRGTNVLLLVPPDIVDPAFGAESRDAHSTLARSAGARYVEMGGPLTLDLDTPEDLLVAQGPEGTPE